MVARSKIDKLLAKAKLETIEVHIVLNRELLTEYEAAIAEYADAEEARERRKKKFGDAGGLMSEEDPAEALADKLIELQDAIEADKADNVFRFQKMPYEKFREVIEAHPPTDEIKERNPYLDHDPNQAAPFLVAGSCIDPQMDVEHAQQLRDLLPEGEWAKLYEAAIRANRSGVVIPKDVSSTVARLKFERRSTTPLAAVSPSPSSADE